VTTPCTWELEVEELDDREPATLTYEPTKNARMIRHTARGKTTAPALPLLIPGRIVPMLFKWVARILNAEKRSPRFQHPVPGKRECGWLGRAEGFRGDSAHDISRAE